MKSKTGRAMEMTVHGKRGKPKAGFPSFPTALGNPKAGFPLSHSASLLFHIKKENNNTRLAAPTFRLILGLEYTQWPNFSTKLRNSCIQNNLTNDFTVPILGVPALLPGQVVVP